MPCPGSYESRSRLFLIFGFAAVASIPGSTADIPIALIVIAPLALLMIHLAAPTPTGTLLFDRGVETLIGVLIGILIGYVTRDRKQA